MKRKQKEYQKWVEEEEQRRKKELGIIQLEETLRAQREEISRRQQLAHDRVKKSVSVPKKSQQSKV